MTKEEFCKEEIRNDYLVSTKIKKVWYTQLELFKEFKDFCQKYNLRFFADYGTLLGAVRHKGFIPWDDDMDFTMFRPDYQRMLELAPEYFQSTVYFQNYHSESGASLVYNFSRLRDERTTCLGKGLNETVNDHPGIFIDIFPLDAVPPFQVTSTPGGIYDVAMDIWLAASSPRELLDKIISGYIPSAGIDTMLDVLGLPMGDRLTLYENILTGAFDKSETINFFPSMYSNQPYLKSWYADIVELPFEYLTVPAPKEFDLILKTYYGNYMEPVMYASDHEFELIDPDRPYTEYLE
ncbi:lipopolysaccharide cholinephosphotransferase [Lachnospiraceae bacterium XBB2008]|nr:lipopolysaccharide cholinephosphotransferase [Lachnospiraceae bacterium XBB2008]